MMLKKDAKTLTIKEQFIDDAVNGLTLVFRVTSRGKARVHIIGDSLPFGNRDFQFDAKGKLAGTGTGCGGCEFCKV